MAKKKVEIKTILVEPKLKMRLTLKDGSKHKCFSSRGVVSDDYEDCDHCSLDTHHDEVNCLNCGTTYFKKIN